MHFVCQTSSARYGDTGVSQDDLKRGRLRQIVLSILVQDISILGKGSFFYGLVTLEIKMNSKEEHE